MADSPVFRIGIDGGGTACRAALLAGGVRHEVTLGPANVSSDFASAIAMIRAALSQLAAVAGLSEGALAAAPAHLGLAGVVDDDMAARVAAALPLSRAVVTDDQPTTVAGALGDRDGAVAAVGTGSFIGGQKGGAIRRLGGWGFAIGDQASGAWLGRRALEAVMLARDGLEAETGLTRHLWASLGGSPGAVIGFAMTARPADFAGLARDIAAAADAGDPLGRRLMDEGTDYLRRGLDVLGWTAGEALVLTGGLGPAYAARIGLPTVSPRGTALDGALALAGRAAT